MLLRKATKADAADLAVLEAAREPPDLCVGAAVLGQQSDTTTVAVTAGSVVGALRAVQFTHLGELLEGSSASRAQQLHREGGALLLVTNIWLAEGWGHELEAELLRCLMLKALQAGEVRHVLLPTLCRAEIAALGPGADVAALRCEPHVEMQLARGAKLLQHVLPEWWPAHAAEPAGTPCVAAMRGEIENGTSVPPRCRIAHASSLTSAVAPCACACMLARLAVAAGLLTFSLMDIPADEDGLLAARLAACSQPETHQPPSRQHLRSIDASLTPPLLDQDSRYPPQADAQRFVTVAHAPRWPDRTPRPLESQPLLPPAAFNFAARRRSTEPASRRASTGSSHRATATISRRASAASPLDAIS